MLNVRLSLPIHTRRQCQTGSVLIIGMLLLLMMTLLALLTTSETRTDARITANALDRALAFQAAEAVLLQLEKESVFSQEKLGGIGFDDLDCFFDDYTIDTHGAQVPHEPSPDFNLWDDSNTCSPRDFSESPIPSSLALTNEPVFVIDKLTPSDVHDLTLDLGVEYAAHDQSLYRITVIAYGRSPSTQAVVQSVYKPG